MFIILSKEIAKNLHHSFSLYREPLFVHSFFFHIHVQYLNRRGIKKLQEKKTQKKKDTVKSKKSVVCGRGRKVYKNNNFHSYNTWKPDQITLTITPYMVNEILFYFLDSISETFLEYVNST